MSINRLQRMRQKMWEESLDAYVVVRPENVRYLSGFTGGEATLFITDSEAHLLTDFRYLEQAAMEAPKFMIQKTGKDHYLVLEVIGKKVRRIGFEGDVVTYEDYKKLRSAFPQGECLSRPDLINHLRSVKDPTEIETIRQAVKIADQALAKVLGHLKVGQREEEIGLQLEYAMRQAGASKCSFESIVASGVRSALPHGIASAKQICWGEFLTMDFGAVYQGYCSDITRTVFLGEPEKKHREVYDVVLAAQLAGIAAVAPGRTGREVDAAARDVITQAGYGAYFGHGLGHSVGLAVHEEPNLNSREERVLEPGMTVTVEPGIYIPDWGGVRIEDLVLVTETGCEVLTQVPKELWALK